MLSQRRHKTDSLFYLNAVQDQVKTNQWHESQNSGYIWSRDSDCKEKLLEGWYCSVSWFECWLPGYNHFLLHTSDLCIFLVVCNYSTTSSQKLSHKDPSSHPPSPKINLLKLDSTSGVVTFREKINYISFNVN